MKGRNRRPATSGAVVSGGNDAPSSGGANPWRTAAALAAVALIVRLLYFAQMKSSPFAGHPLVDADTYDQWAQDILRGAWIGHEAFWQPPLYPYCLALLYKIAGHSYDAVRVAQGLLSAGSVALLYVVGVRTVGRGAATAAALLYAFYGTAIFFDGLLLSPSLIVFLELLLLHRVLQAIERPTGGRWAAAGLALGLSILARPEIGLAGVGIAAWIAGARGRAWAPAVRRRALAAFLVVAALCTATATWHNYQAEGEWVLVSYNGGVNFFLGNNAQYDDTVNARPFFEWRRLARAPVRQGITGAAAQSSWYFRQSLEWMAHHPGDAVQLWGRKFALTLRGREVMRNEDPYAARRYSSLLAGLLWMRGVAMPFGLFGPLAAVGLWVGRPRREGALLWMTAAASLITCVAFFVSARYRLPAIPILALWAGQALVWAWSRLRAGEPFALVRASGAWVALVALCNIGQGPATPPAVAAETELSLATIATTDGQYETALFQCRAARAIKSPYPEADYEQANAFLQVGRPDSAAVYAARSAQQAPDIEDTWQLLAVAEQQQARYGEAATAARRALLENPTLPGARSVLAVALAQLGDAAGAHAQAESTAALPGLPPLVAATIARVYWAVGDSARAVDLLESAVAAGAPPEVVQLRDAIRASSGPRRNHTP